MLRDLHSPTRGLPEDGLWHVGHVPTLIKNGEVRRRDYGGHQ